MLDKIVANKPAFRFWFAVYGFTAFILTIAVVVFAWLASESRKEAGEGRTAARPANGQQIPPERLRLLASFEAPAYSVAPDVKAPPGFSEAMQRYSARDYSGAIPGLRTVVRGQPDFVAGRFYLGICLLLTNDHVGGIQQLRSVIAAPASPAPGPYVEQARFFLAKALLADADRTGALQQLDVVIALQGNLETEARALLAEIQ